ncbi:hypothetical protein EW146_g7970 [Bondarzewia mesenterica]|uniref:Thioredoxin domain-containing protein n=1 Tax=Bondarzewia mesenterica TaxID=1095465 RepID=A0A4S4LI30_9AGAM|nr:hypothetical protein EW146_g7970 [Bondarzewia mesenterica]
MRPSLRHLRTLARPSSALPRPRAPCRTPRTLTIPSTPGETGARRAYSSENKYTTPAQERDRATVGVFTPTAAALFILAGTGLFFYFRWEKQRLLEEKQKEMESRAVGRAHIGGPFQMITHEGKLFSEKDLLGKWNLIYFGFTNCPDICPDELDKMSAAVDELDKSVPQMARYVADFHPRLVGLTGDYATAKATCKAYRVYFSTPPDATAEDDYLVDHSIFFYFMDPEGKFVDAFGKASSVEDVVERVSREVGDWKAVKGRLT